ncbi:MAG: rubrerythrin family protein [Chloroflexi bacterium]|nr:rubrerythrin family protein [Chloroflexota bacterium]
MSKTTDNLQAAFAGESQAGRKYTAFAKKAEDEGYPQIAKLFRAAAMAESVHAINHFKAFGGVSSTSDNLKAAIAGENYEVTTMYPPMIADAEAEGDKKGPTSFKWAYEVEKVHEALYRYALEHMDPNAPVPEYYVCPFCGYTHEGKFEGKCPVCGTPAEKFLAVE